MKNKKNKTVKAVLYFLFPLCSIGKENKMSNITIIKDHKFKNIVISVRFLSKLNKEEIAAKMVLANVLNDVSNTYDTKQKAIQQLDYMYGSALSITSSIIGDGQITVAKAKSIHPKFIDNKVDLLKEQFALLASFLLDPLRENDSFLKSNIEEAKKMQEDYLKRVMDDPSAFSMQEATRIAAKEQPLGVSASQTIKQVQELDVEAVNEQYKKMINNDKVDILVFGDVDETYVLELANTYLKPIVRDQEAIKVNYCLNHTSLEPIIYGYRDISQSYISSVYTTSIANDDKRFPALRVANAIFGQLPSGLLFQNVREKNSLCYSIYSMINPYDGALMISTGVEAKNIQKTLQLIKEQFEVMQCGDFSDDLLSTAKIMLINSLQSANDDIDSILAFAYRNILLNSKETIAQSIAAIEQVSKEDVIAVMQQCQYVTSYVLTQKGEADE